MIKKRIIFAVAFTVIVLLAFILYFLLTWKVDIAVNGIEDSKGYTQKLKEAVLGDGIIEFTESEVNGIITTIIKEDEKLENKIKYAYISIADEKFLINIIIPVYNHDLYTSFLVKPEMAGTNISMNIENMTVGKVAIPINFFMSAVKSYLPENFKILNNNSLDIGNKIFNNEISGISVENNMLKIALKLDSQYNLGKIPDNPSGSGKENGAVAEAGSTSVVTPSMNQPEGSDTIKDAQSGGDTVNGSMPVQPGPTPEPIMDDEIKMRIAALSDTNSQLYKVLEEVKSSGAKSWIETVISVNSKMLQDINNSYTSDINAAKAVYKKLSEDVKYELKTAAFKNMNVSAVRFLIDTYDMQ
ncbi:hypothetical protein OXPF_13080 [Oxobacter pfennigii]|uniref:Uncharacterized protein n=1 Tax=Oxobacter pfennigii TaxID=36849 RepID=A0A0P8YD66_9CLOT|nr:hypothetical protein [Oxobacter pfennigii]KPU45181.1 hypothetical protein OXPF_13080 [Oxobacter pfennigii]